MRRKQSQIERAQRLRQGRCPIHGISMPQVDGWFYPTHGEPYTIVGCPRRDCHARAMANSYDGPWKLLPECAYLLSDTDILSTLQAQIPAKKFTRAPRARKSDIWAKTEGRCYYCGLTLELKTTFCVDHIIPKIEGGRHHIDNVVPACKSCNSAKGSKQLEEFRFYRRMQKFQQQNGVAFTLLQVEYLKSIGVELSIPEHVFWFEQTEKDNSTRNAIP